MNITRMCMLMFTLSCASLSYAQISYQTDFESQSVGTAYERTVWQSDGFNTDTWDNNLADRTAVNNEVSVSGTQSLKITYPAGGFGPNETGCQVKLLFTPQNEAYMSYNLRFSENFTWGTTSYGGKLPGLAGGDNCSGGASCDGTNGFSARFMWRTGGAAVLYLYHMDKPETYGEDHELLWPSGEQVIFEKGEWYHMMERVKMNTDGSTYDGEVQVWVNGIEVLHLTGLRFTNNGDKIDNLYISTFHGGSDATWAPTETCYTYIDDVTISSDINDVTYKSCEGPNLGDNTSLCGTSSITLDSHASPTNATFSWYKDGAIIPGESGSTYNATQTGTYVVVYDSLGCFRKDTIDITSTLQPNLGNDRAICASSFETLAPQDHGDAYTYVWDKGGVDIDGETGPTLDVFEAGTYGVTVSAGSCTSVRDEVVLTSSLIDVPSVSGNEGESVTLSINDSGTNYGWYDQAVDGTELQTGMSYSATVGATDSYVYVQDLDGYSGIVGKETAPVTWTDNRFDRRMKFEVFRDLTIDSITIFVVADQDVVINILESDEITVAKTKTFSNLAAGEQRIALNFDLSAGVYYMSAEGSTGYLRHSYEADTDISFPYTVDGLISILGSNLSWIDAKPYYLFFYKWRVSAGNSCARTPVKITSIPAVVDNTEAFDEFLVDKTFQTFSSYTNQAQPSASADATVTIDPTQPIYGVRQSLFGQNAVAWQGNVTTTDIREQNWKNANYTFLRYPGGNWSNIFFWDGTIPSTIQTDPALPNGTADLKSGTDAWMLETDEFPDLLSFTGANPIVCVNVGWAFYGTDADPVATAAQYAANWVNYYNNTLGLNVKYWELGNENYGSWQAGYDLGTPADYANACVAFANAMKAVDPTIKVGVVLYEGAGGLKDEPQGKDWNETILPIVKDDMDFAILHQYPHPNTNKNDLPEQEMYDAVSTIEELTTLMESQFTTYAGKQFPIAITEFNARTGVRELSYSNALFMTMMMGEMALHDVNAAMQWDLQNGLDADGGNHAATASKDPFMTKGDANVTLYVHYFMSKYFGDTIVESTSSSSDIVVYPTTFSSGEYGVVIVNRGESDKTVELDFDNVVLGDRMYWHTIRGDGDDFDRTIFINDVGPSTTFTVGQDYTDESGTVTLTATSFEENGVGGPQNYTSIDPYSSLITPGVAPKFDAPALSVTYMVLESGGSNCAIPDLGNDKTICGVSSLTLDTQLPTTGNTFTWYKDDVVQSETGNTFDISTAGTYKVEVNNGSCIATDVVEIQNTILQPNIGSDITLCESTYTTLDAGVTGAGLSYSWDRDGDVVGGEQTFDAYAAGTYTLTVSANGCSDVTDQIIISSDLVDVTFDTICSAGVISLVINDTGSFAWYDSATNGTELSTAATYSPSITSSTTYYVQDNNTSQQTLGKSAVDGTVWGNTTADIYAGWGRTFEYVVEQELTIVSMDVSVAATANMVLNISDGGSYNQTFNFNGLATGVQTITLNETLAPGTYTVDLIGTTGGIRIQVDNNDSNSYPGLMSWSCTESTDHYGFFYNILVETGTSCSRTPVLAIIDPTHPDCGFVTQTINLEAGWNFISTNVHPADSSVETLFIGLDVDVVKDADGFWKAGQATEKNSLTHITAGEGYLVYMNNPGVLAVSGSELIINNYQLIINSGWQMIGCPYQSSTPFSTDFNATNTEVIKNFDGFWEPGGGLNSIFNLEPGEGYYLRGK